MKKLGKLTISPEKIMKNEELINLQGGYDVSCECYLNGVNMGTGLCGGYSDCNQCAADLSAWYVGDVVCH